MFVQRAVVKVLFATLMSLVCILPVQAKESQPKYNPLILENKTSTFIISDKTGALCEGWDRASNTKLIAKCNDRYRIETIDKVITLQEKQDKVVSYKKLLLNGKPAIFLVCKNDLLPSLIIEKQYVLGQKRELSKRLSFRTTDKKGFFIQYIYETHLDPAYRKKVWYAGVEPEYGYRLTPLYYLPNREQEGSRGVVTSRDFTLGLAGFRYRINNRFVIRRGLVSLMGPRVIGTPTGWYEPVFTDYLKAGQQVSAEVRWVMFSGDFTTFERYYQALPECRKIYNYSRPSWLKRLVVDIKTLTWRPGQLRLIDKFAPFIATGCIWFLNPPFGNWGPFDDPPLRSHPNVFSIAPGIKRRCPNIKVSAYTRGENFDKNSVIYKNHPYFGITGKDGKLLLSHTISDSTRQRTFYRQLLARWCREFYIHQYCDRLREWKLDLIYIDSPGCNGIPDWKLLDVCQWYDWLDYFKSLRNAIQKIDPNAAIFVNEWNLPYSDIGYIEWAPDDWNKLAGANWRGLAFQLFLMKLNEPDGQIIIPMGTRPAVESAYYTYTIAYGWCPQIKGARKSDIHRIPYAMSAWELRGIKLVEDAVEPRWWRSAGNLETYGFKKGQIGLVSIISHYSSKKEVTITVNPRKLGFKVGKPIYAYLLTMKNPRNFSGTHAFKIEPLQEYLHCPEYLRFTTSTEPALLKLIVLNNVPAILESVDNRPIQTGLTEHLDVTIRGNRDKNKINLNIDCRADTAAILVPKLTPDKTHIQIDGKVEIGTGKFGGGSALRLQVRKGKHKVSFSL